jgi:hypothetical protein
MQGPVPAPLPTKIPTNEKSGLGRGDSLQFNPRFHSRVAC